MTITQAVMQRYSTKSFDPAKKISDEVMNSIKTLLRYSPSSVNIQPWHFIIAASEEGKTGSRHPPARALNLIPPKLPTPLMLCCCAQKQMWMKPT